MRGREKPKEIIVSFFNQDVSRGRGRGIGAETRQELFLAMSNITHMPDW